MFRQLLTSLILFCCMSGLQAQVNPDYAALISNQQAQIHALKQQTKTLRDELDGVKAQVAFKPMVINATLSSNLLDGNTNTNCHDACAGSSMLCLDGRVAVVSAGPLGTKKTIVYGCFVGPQGSGSAGASCLCQTVPGWK